MPNTHRLAVRSSGTARRRSAKPASCNDCTTPQTTEFRNRPFSRTHRLRTQFLRVNFRSRSKPVGKSARRSGEMADAPDSKSGRPKNLCGFESHLRYRKEPSNRWVLFFACEPEVPCTFVRLQLQASGAMHLVLCTIAVPDPVLQVAVVRNTWAANRGEAKRSPCSPHITLPKSGANVRCPATSKSRLADHQFLFIGPGKSRRGDSFHTTCQSRPCWV
jgi:hypothetical protein